MSKKIITTNSSTIVESIDKAKFRLKIYSINIISYVNRLLDIIACARKEKKMVAKKIDKKKGWDIKKGMYNNIGRKNTSLYRGGIQK